MKMLVGTFMRSSRRLTCVCVGLGAALFFNIDGIAQSAVVPATAASGASADRYVPAPLKLHYDAPLTFPIGAKGSVLFSDFKCGPEGSIFLPMAQDISTADPQQPTQDLGSRLAVVALRPSGEVVRFIPQAISGYRNLVSLLRYFVSDSHVYLLEMADKVDSEDSRKTVGRSRFIQVFDHKGQLTQTILLGLGVNPSNIAVFESGDILILSVDELNKTTRLILLDSAGRQESELKLFDEDFASRFNLAAKGDSASLTHDGGDALSQLLAVASLTSYGEDLLLTASQRNFPVLELNQHGIVRSTTLNLPDSTTIQSLLPSDDKLLHVLVGTFHMIPSSNAAGAEPSGETRGFSPTEIDEFYSQDGSIARRISLVSPGPKPVCEADGKYIFIAPRAEDGRLQIVRASPIP